ncbi:MAG: zinc ribbon domain-containing protein [bacterium]
MFFLMGLNQKRKEITYPYTLEGERVSVYLIYSVLWIFFIPVFSFGKKYYVETSHELYALDRKVGRLIEKGQDVMIGREDLTLIRGGCKRCPNCGYTASDGYDYCPRCGSKME